MKIALFGTFDVENYGDLLFPLIVRNRLADVCREFVFVSPTDSPPVWRDCAEAVSFERFLRDAGDVSGILVGGGHIVHPLPTTLERYSQTPRSACIAYPSLWLGAAYIAAARNLPCCWNAPGIPGPFPRVGANLLQWAASVTDYLSVRDKASRSFAKRAGIRREIPIMPDTALDVSRLWSADEIDQAYANAFAARGRSVPERTLAFGLKWTSLTEDTASLARRIDRICTKRNATPILIPFGPCHGDDILQAEIARQMTTDPLLPGSPPPRSLLETTACVARSEAYLGTSLHGAITACSFGRRALLVGAETKGKSQGFLEQFALAAWLSDTWADAEKRIDTFFAAPLAPWQSVLGKAAPALDRHWASICTALASSVEKKSRLPELLDLNKAGATATPDEQIFGALLAQSAVAADPPPQSPLQPGDAERLHRWMEELDRRIPHLLASRRWKAGHALAELLRKILRRPPKRMPSDHITRILTAYHAWQRNRPPSGK